MAEEDKILEIMREIYYNPEQIKPAHFIEKYGQKSWNLFSQYALGQLCRQNPDDTLKLSQDGAAEYHKLVQDKAMLERTHSLTLGNMALAVSTVALAFVALFRWAEESSVITQEAWAVIILTVFLVLAFFLAICAVGRMGLTEVGRFLKGNL
ncbi:MAG: hypothetical protein AB1295_06310 [Candidatus Micrarchaeota archaeon]